MVAVSRARCALFAATLWLPLSGSLAGCARDSSSAGQAESIAPQATPQPVDSEAAASTEPAGAAPKPCPELSEAPTALPAPERLVAIGDVHGDIAALRQVLRLAGAIDERDDWAGADLVVVQTGDILDRGDSERAILDWLARLRTQAQAAGGAILFLNGNHELMNATWDFRYVTPGGFREFADVTPDPNGTEPRLPAQILDQIPESMRGRAHAFRPGGTYTRQLAEGNVAQKVGSTVFAHGGISPRYAEYGLERINREIRCWLADSRSAPSDIPVPGHDPEGPVWNRSYSLDPPDCQALERALTTLDARRMVVGHTVQQGGITSACDGRIWRIDTGIADFYGGPRQALEIRGDQVTVLGTPEKVERKP